MEKKSRRRSVSKISRKTSTLERGKTAGRHIVKRAVEKAKLYREKGRKKIARVKKRLAL